MQQRETLTRLEHSWIALAVGPVLFSRKSLASWPACACARTFVHHSWYVTNSSISTPQVMNTSPMPRLATTTGLTFRSRARRRASTRESGASAHCDPAGHRGPRRGCSRRHGARDASWRPSCAPPGPRKPPGAPCAPPSAPFVPVRPVRRGTARARRVPRAVRTLRALRALPALRRRIGDPQRHRLLVDGRQVRVFIDGRQIRGAVVGPGKHRCRPSPHRRRSRRPAGWCGPVVRAAPERAGGPVRLLLPVRGPLLAAGAVPRARSVKDSPCPAPDSRSGRRAVTPATCPPPGRAQPISPPAASSPHSTSQLASIRWPCSVSTDSGWNCTPSTRSSR
ncbi:hypothetical protein SHIRM173S_09647 [Streptomyces hirsutus]